MYESELIAQQDQQRTARSFISFLSSAMGLDQTYAGQDGYAVNYPRQYQVIGQNGAVGMEGVPYSNIQQKSVLTSPLVLLLGFGAVAFLVLKR